MILDEHYHPRRRLEGRKRPHEDLDRAEALRESLTGQASQASELLYDIAGKIKNLFEKTAQRVQRANESLDDLPSGRAQVISDNQYQIMQRLDAPRDAYKEAVRLIQILTTLSKEGYINQPRYIGLTTIQNLAPQEKTDIVDSRSTIEIARRLNLNFQEIDKDATRPISLITAPDAQSFKISVNQSMSAVNKVRDQLDSETQQQLVTLNEMIAKLLMKVSQEVA